MTVVTVSSLEREQIFKEELIPNISAHLGVQSLSVTPKLS